MPGASSDCSKLGVLLPFRFGLALIVLGLSSRAGWNTSKAKENTFVRFKGGGSRSYVNVYDVALAGQSFSNVDHLQANR